MIINHLPHLLVDKKWSQADLARKTGIRANTINLLYHNLCDRVNLEHLSLICAALNCAPGDIFEYVPPNRDKAQPNKREIVKVVELDTVVEAVVQMLYSRPRTQLKARV